MKLDNRRQSKNVQIDSSYLSPQAKKFAQSLGLGPAMEKRSRPTKADALKAKMKQRYGED